MNLAKHFHMVAIASIFLAPTLQVGAKEIAFTDYTPLSSDFEIARRMTTPLQSAGLSKRSAKQPANLADETFTLFVPTTIPKGGYGLLVFIPPWEHARVPEGWADKLEQRGIIFVSPNKSGNEQTIFGRRVPLALLAEENVSRRYLVNKKRVYIGGFSGGSRVAMRIALAYPDIFHAALLDAGSDPIANETVPIPPRDLFTQFQNSSKLIFVTGDKDTPRLGMAAVSEESMREWCVFEIDTQKVYGLGHEILEPAPLERALEALEMPVSSDPKKLLPCRAKIEAALAEKFQKVESLAAASNKEAAKKLLTEIDETFGGLAAPRSISTMATLSVQ